MPLGNTGPFLRGIKQVVYGVIHCFTVAAQDCVSVSSPLKLFTLTSWTCPLLSLASQLLGHLGATLLIRPFHETLAHPDLVQTLGIEQ